jgi:NADH:ubiquinone oxidoreductase subunit 3 (subunit A)
MKSKMSKLFIFLIVALVLSIMMNVRFSGYDNQCDESKTYESGYRCYSDDEQSFSIGVKKCENCKTKWLQLKT